MCRSAALISFTHRRGISPKSLGNDPARQAVFREARAPQPCRASTREAIVNSELPSGRFRALASGAIGKHPLGKDSKRSNRASLEFGHRKTCRRQTEVPRESFTVYRGGRHPLEFWRCGHGSERAPLSSGRPDRRTTTSHPEHIPRARAATLECNRLKVETERAGPVPGMV